MYVECGPHNNGVSKAQWAIWWWGKSWVLWHRQVWGTVWWVSSGGKWGMGVPVWGNVCMWEPKVPKCTVGTRHCSPRGCVGSSQLGKVGNLWANCNVLPWACKWGPTVGRGCGHRTWGGVGIKWGTHCPRPELGWH